MTIKVVTTDTATLANGIKCLVYGNAGVGKTRLLASAPKPIIISAEKGLLSLRKFKLPAIEISSLAQLGEAYQYVAGPQGQAYTTVCLDSVSEIAEVVLAEEKAKTKDGRKAYGEMQDDMVQILRDFRNLPRKHVVFLAKQERIQDGTTGGMLFGPSFPGKQLAQAAPYFFDEVWQLVNFQDPATGLVTRALRTSPDAQNTAKDRSGALAYWENADPATGGGLDYLFNKMLAA